jgi:general stress protein 26
LQETEPTTTDSSEPEPIERIRRMIKGARVAMLTTVDPDGHLHSRPMATQEVTPEGDVWMFTSADSAKAGEIRNDANVSLTWSRPGLDRYVCACGVAEVVDDRDRMRTLWNPLYKAWFPQGLDDRDLRLVRVRLVRAEWWSTPGRNITQAVGFVKALVSGQRWEPPEKVHGSVELREPVPTPAPPPSKRTKRTIGSQTGGHEQGAPPKPTRTKK